MTFTFKLARRLARVRSGALMASLLTVACAGTESPSGPESDPGSNDPTAIDVFPDTASVGVDGEVQFDAQIAPADETTANHRWWRRIVAVQLKPGAVQLAPGATQNYRATGTTSSGSTVELRLQWTATGGQVDGSGKYVAGKRPGKYIVVAKTSNGLADTSGVTIVDTSAGSPGGGDNTVGSVTVSPASATLTEGQTKQVNATVRDPSGNTIANAAVSWHSSNTSTAKVSNSGVVTAVSGGQAVITAISGDKQDQASFTITASAPPPPPPPSSPPPSGSFAGCPASGYSRLVSVSSASQLSSALSSAQPGDQIQLAAGTYSGIRNITRSGTASRPIVLCGPRSAVFTGDTRLNNADWWVLQGFTMRDGFQPIYAVGSNNNRVQGLEIYNVGQEAIHLRCGSSDNVVQANWIHDTGRSTPQYGEAVYLGTDQTQWSSMCGSSQPDHSDRNEVLDNEIGPNVRGDHIDIKEGTTGGLIRGNRFDGTGTSLINGMVYDWVTVKGNGYTIENNRGSRAPRDGIWGFVKVQGWGNNNVYRGNVFDVQAPGYGIRTDGGSGNVVYCDNVVTNAGAGRTNVSCR